MGYTGTLMQRVSLCNLLICVILIMSRMLAAYRTVPAITDDNV